MCGGVRMCGEALLPPPDLVNVSNYCSAFNAHLLVCVDRQALPVASDLVDLMLAKRLPVEPTLLHALLQKLGKQNFWLRAREVFRCESSFYVLNTRQTVVQATAYSFIRQTR